jgi:replication factor A1
VQFHYALVDDLLTREEFERRVEEKMEQCGNLVDEVTAAMLVVQDCGRHHVKVKDLSGKSTLFCFFAKVIERSEPREFERTDGEKGLVNSLILGDETGQVRSIFWDEKAHASREIDTGEVLEVIGKHAGKGKNEITVLALRKAACEIHCQSTVEAYLSPPTRKDLAVQLLARGETRSISRRDGSSGEMIEAMVGEGDEVTRLVCWIPELLEGIPDNTPLRITGALEKIRPRGKEYRIDEKSTLERGEDDIPVRFSPLARVTENNTFSVKERVKSLQQARAFTSRDGRSSHVRNLILTDGVSDLPVVLWGDHALQPLITGDEIALFQGSGRTGRSGERELHAGGGSMIRVIPSEEGEEIEIAGTSIVTLGGTFLDNGSERYLVTGSLPHGREVRARGIRSGKRIALISFTEEPRDPEEIRKKAEELICSLSSSDTFTLHGRQPI